MSYNHAAEEKKFQIMEEELYHCTGNDARSSNRWRNGLLYCNR